ncbi:hypothetical protein BC835DRAFT_959278 [Cytidiella melzeri]|nr:hypothetical protein BC835DRAFT_959278 [Cytidiella melzeri]
MVYQTPLTHSLTHSIENPKSKIPLILTSQVPSLPCPPTPPKKRSLFNSEKDKIRSCRTKDGLGLWWNIFTKLNRHQELFSTTLVLTPLTVPTVFPNRCHDQRGFTWIPQPGCILHIACLIAFASLIEEPMNPTNLYPVLLIGLQEQPCLLFSPRGGAHQQPANCSCVQLTPLRIDLTDGRSRGKREGYKIEWRYSGPQS